MTRHLAPAACTFPRSARQYHGFLRRVRSTRNFGRADFAASGYCSGCWYCYYCCCYCYYCSGPGRACFVVLASWAPIYRHCRKARAAHDVKSRCASGSFMGLLTNSLIGSFRRLPKVPTPSAEHLSWLNGGWFSSRKLCISRSLIAEYEAVRPRSLFQK